MPLKKCVIHVLDNVMPCILPLSLNSATVLNALLACCPFAHSLADGQCGAALSALSRH
jgi:hypothetical protein